MSRSIRTLPLAIVAMALLTGIKLVGLVHGFNVATPARASTAPAAHAVSERPRPASPAPPKPAVAAAPAEPPVSEAERAVLQELRARRSQLDVRASAADERDALLAAAERRLTERMDQLKALQTKLEQLESGRRERDEANWRGLVKTYETMRPRDAAAILNDLDSPVLMQVLDRMKEAKAAPILAAMLPERARAATAQLAEWRTRNSAAPEIGRGASGARP